jgi:hypothetical protein
MKVCGLLILVGLTKQREMLLGLGENAPSDVLSDEIKKAIVTIQNCIDQTQKLPDICMEVVDDLLQTNQFQQV